MIWKNEVVSHLLVTLVYFVFVSVLRWKLDFNLIWLWFGALFGTFFLDIDHLLYWFITHPEKEDSKEAKNIWNQNSLKFKEKLKKLYDLGQKWHNTHNRLMFHSAVAQVVLLLLSFYILTSGGSIFGSALIMSINLHLLKDVWTDFFERKEYLKDYLFWQVREPKIKEHIGEYLIIVSLIFLILTRFIL